MERVKQFVMRQRVTLALFAAAPCAAGRPAGLEGGASEGGER